MIIRPFTSADVPGCARIMAENPLWQRYGITLESATQRLADGLAQNATILAACTHLPHQAPAAGLSPPLSVHRRPASGARRGRWAGGEAGSGNPGGADPHPPAGFVWYVEKGAFFRSGYIMLIGVDPTHQGQGIGEALMDAAEQRMFEKTKDVFLLVSDFNGGAQRFYQRRGYVQVGALPGYVLPEVAELIFRKTRPA